MTKIHTRMAKSRNYYVIHEKNFKLFWTDQENLRPNNRNLDPQYNIAFFSLREAASNDSRISTTIPDEEDDSLTSNSFDCPSPSYSDKPQKSNFGLVDFSSPFYEQRSSEKEKSSITKQATVKEGGEKQAKEQGMTIEPFEQSPNIDDDKESSKVIQHPHNDEEEGSKEALEANLKIIVIELSDKNTE